MALSALETWLYMLMVVTLYTSPLSIGLLALGYFKGFLGKAAKGIVIALPVLATAIHFTYRMDHNSHVATAESASVVLDLVFQQGEEPQLIQGHRVGYWESADGVRHQHWQFPLSSLGDQVLDIKLPPTGWISAASVTSAQALPGLATGQLLLPGKGIYHSPFDRPVSEYINDHYPALNAKLESTPLIILIPATGRSATIVYQEADSWRHQNALLDFETLQSAVKSRVKPASVPAAPTRALQD